ncbi:DNA cytosine methyltransferase [Roseburia faecis]|nr:DNA cytosine methyltransferase [Roseburia faecis]
MQKGRNNMINGELVVDNFAGGGGASTGIELATGYSVDIAINHDPEAIKMHKVNHPNTKHYCENVWEVDPVKACKGHPVGLAWFSPDCKHFSKAKGGKPVEKNIRGLAWVVLKWAALVRPRVIMLENVEEFQTWGPCIPIRDKDTGRVIVSMVGRHDREKNEPRTRVADPGEVVPVDRQIFQPDPKRSGQTYKKWRKQLEALGYEIDTKELVAADYGAPTMRKRFFMIARCDGKPIVWPEPTHGPADSEEVKKGLLKPYVGAYTQLDFSLPCPSIFDTSEEIKEKYGIRAVRPLAQKTMDRIARGLKKFVLDNPEPFIIQCNHSGKRRPNDIREPMPTITGKHGYGIVEPKLAPYMGTNTTNHPGGNCKDPIHTITTGNQQCLISPTLIQYHSETAQGEVRGQTIKDPIMTVDGSNRYGLVASFLHKYYDGGYTGAGDTVENPLPTVTSWDHNSLCAVNLIQMNNHCDGRDVKEPIPTITAGDGHFGEVRAFLIKYYGQGTGQDVKEPLDTVTSRDRFGLVTINGTDYQIVDIGLRMLEPKELYGCQGFPDDYIIDHDYTGKTYPRSEQVRRCGNAVCPPIPAALVKANLPELCVAKRTGNMRIAQEQTGQLRFA